MATMRGIVRWAPAVVLSVALGSPVAAQGIGTAFTYQGRLTDAGSPATGLYDFRFILFDAAAGGSPVGPMVTRDDVGVTGGLFTTSLDFGAAAFSGNTRFLEIAVRPGSSTGAYSILGPPQELTPTPNALFTAVAPWAGVSGKPPGFADNTDNDSGGDVTGVTAGLGLAGGGASGEVTLSANLAALQSRVTGSCPAGQSIRLVNMDGTVACQPDTTGTDWGLTGNAGTNPAANFIGTSDSQPLELRVNGGRAFRLEPTANGPPNVVGGFAGNTVTPGAAAAVIAGGVNNTVTDQTGTVGGGGNNRAGNAAGSIFDASGATVSGGDGNTASGARSTVAGGLVNLASGADSTVAGGQFNLASGALSTVSGGADNWASGVYSTVLGGDNTAGGDYSLAAGAFAQVRTPAEVGGGDLEGDQGTFVWADAIGVGFQSTGPNQFLVRASGGVGINTNAPASALHVAGTATMTGFKLTTAPGAGRVLTSDATGNGTWMPATGGGDITGVTAGLGLSGGGLSGDVTLSVNPVTTQSRVTGSCPVGQSIRVVNENGTVACQPDTTGADWGLTGNVGTNPAANFIGTTDSQPLEFRVNGSRALRLDPTANGYVNVVGGIVGTVTPPAYGAVIAGGAFNTVTDYGGTVGGGLGNQAGNVSGTTSDAPGATVSGGDANTASGGYSTVSGGASNMASGARSTVSGGDSNHASGNHSTVLGGFENVAGGNYSLATGARARVRTPNEVGGGDLDGDQGTFLWNDAQGPPFQSTGPNQFLVRAGGGVGINTNAPVAGNALTVSGDTRVTGNLGFGSVTRQMLNLWGTQYGIGVQTSTTYFRSDLDFAWFKAGAHNDTQNDAGPGGVRLMRLDAGGNLRVLGTVSGGGADLAEMLPAREDVEPGDVLAIGPDGRLARSTEPYQDSLAGVYSTKPGLLGGAADGEDLTGKVPLAMSGVIPVKVTAENGPITPGDSLTSSSTPGRAMKAAKVRVGGVAFFPSGVILGKALEPLASGEGVIQALVVLQ